MTVEVLAGYDAVSERAANLVADCIRRRPRSVLGLATGSTPVGLYARLLTHDLDFSRLITFNLDEYVGLDACHRQSYRFFMWHHFFTPAGMRPEQVHFPESGYDAHIVRSGGIDLQILGLGSNGHIAFNEPGSSHHSGTRTVTLAEQTVRDNARFFVRVEDVPRQAITMGIGSILAARRILLLATGAAKAPAVAAALEGPVTTLLPASALQGHPSVHVLLDEAAASHLDTQYQARP